MIRIVKKLTGSYRGLINTFKSKIENESGFFYSGVNRFDAEKRFFSARYYVFDSRSCNIGGLAMDSDNARFDRAIIDVIDNSYCVVGYASSKGRFVVCVGECFEKVTDAAKHAQVNKTSQIVDVITGKVFKVNG